MISKEALFLGNGKLRLFYIIEIFYFILNVKQKI